MTPGDQYKGYVDHGSDQPVPAPRLRTLYIAIGLIVVSLVVWALLA